nr:unnamed protein product [Callosobruchus chinensis]
MSEPKKRKTEYSRDPNKWMQWYEECTTDEEPPEGETDSEEEDALSKSSHYSDSEQGMDDIHEEQVDVSPDDDNYYLGKDGTTKWGKVKRSTKIKTRACNIITHLPGPKDAARMEKSEIGIWNLFLDENISQIIVTSTNIYIDKIRTNFSRERDARYTDKMEIRAFIGLLYLIGTLGNSRKNVSKLWNNSRGNGMESCYLAMSLKRFTFLLRCIRFDNIGDRETRKEIDKLAPIREVFELFVNNFQKFFSPGEYVTVDEQLVAFRGNCSFRQYIPSKPAKYGLKVFALCDARTAYTVNMEPYVGKQPEGPYCLGNSAQEIVLRLVQPIEGTNRNITGDNWFTSLPLASSLKAKKLTYVGTVRKNKREIPPEFLPRKDRQEKSSIFGFQEDATLVSYCSKKNKAVLVLSTMHFDDAIDSTTHEERKPEMVTFYNMTKGGVDVLDQLCHNYDVSRSTRRWPMVLFYDLLNITAVNAFCIYRHHCAVTNKNPKRAEFLEALSWELIKPQIERRSKLACMPAEIRRRARILLEIPEEPAPEKEKNGSRGRCYICGRARNKTTRKRCVRCSNWTCVSHLRDVCENCVVNS